MSAIQCVILSNVAPLAPDWWCLSQIIQIRAPLPICLTFSGFCKNGTYYQTSNIRCTKWPNFNVSRLVLHSPLPNSLKPDVNTLRVQQNGRHFPDDICKWIFLSENIWISIKFSLKFLPGGPINDIPALVQIMAWRRSGDKPLSEPMMV